MSVDTWAIWHLECKYYCGNLLLLASVEFEVLVGTVSPKENVAP